MTLIMGCECVQSRGASAADVREALAESELEVREDGSAIRRFGGRPPPPLRHEVDLRALREQLEFYLSDENLRRDGFFHDKISSSAEGWLCMNLVIGCRKIQSLGAAPVDVIAALAASA